MEDWVFVDTCIWASFFTRPSSREKLAVDDLLRKIAWRWWDRLLRRCYAGSAVRSRRTGQALGCDWLIM